MLDTRDMNGTRVQKKKSDLRREWTGHMLRVKIDDVNSMGSLGDFEMESCLARLLVTASASQTT